MIKITTRKTLRDKEPESLSQSQELGTISLAQRELLLANPMNFGDDDHPVQILGVKGDQVIGQMNLVCGQICVEGQNIPILWGSGYKVPPEHRPTGVGLMLLLRMHGLPYTVGAVGASQMSAPLFKKLKWIDLIAPRFVMLRRSRPVFERYLGAGLLTRVSSAVCDLGLKILGYGVAIMTRMATRDLRVEKIERMPEEFDLQLCRIEKQAWCWRSASWLNWILSANSGNPGLFLVKDRQDRYVGYFIITHRCHEEGGGGEWKNFVLGSVKDWMTFDPCAVTDTQLVRLAINQLMRREVDAIDVCVVEPEVGKTLRHCGMRQIGGMHFTFHPLPNTPLAKDQYHHLDAWRIRPADGDYFLF